jgi:two-component system OmpR family sensor kinase
VSTTYAERVRRGPRSLRTRLFLLFTAGAAIILLGAAAFLYVVLDRALLDETNEGLRARADDLAAVMRKDGGQIPEQDVFAQVFTMDGRLLDASPAAAASAVTLSSAELGSVGQGAFFSEDVASLGGEAQLWVQPVEVDGIALVLVVGAPLDSYFHARGRLVPALVFGGPVVVLSIAGAGWLLAGAALRPVRRMAEEADTIAITDLSRRLALPGGEDEIAALAHTLNDMLDRIEASVEHERRFVDDASHELRTPLSILRAELELALGATGAAEVAESLQSALEETDRLARLSGDLLALARARAELGGSKPEIVELHHIVTDLCGGLATGDGPSVRCTGQEVWLAVDKDRVERIVVNLVANAQRYAASAVDVQVRSDAGGAELLVTDDGPGFPASMMPVAFQRFRRGDPTRGRDTGGTGLGLAIVAELVRALGGTIAAGNGQPDAEGDQDGASAGAWVRVRIPGAVTATEPAARVR